MKISYWKKNWFWFTPVVLLVISIPLLRKDYGETVDATLGFTFSTMYSEELGLDWEEVYIAILDELHVKQLRIPVYWNRVEPIVDVYDWSEIDWQLDEAAKRDAQVLLAVGRRLPRWPECHDPLWLPGVSDQVLEQELLEYIELSVVRYKDHPAVVAWQVENEPYLEVFGECPPLDKTVLQKEVALVRSLDNRDIVITESGELSSWFAGGSLADIVGVSIYKVTWNSFWGYFYYPIPPAFYHYKTKAVERFAFAKSVISTELQVEPWTPTPMVTVSLEEQFKSMDLENVRENIFFAKQTGFSEIYLWGVEWWYWLKKYHANETFWNYGKTLFVNETEI